jgi:hypothetical protein
MDEAAMSYLWQQLAYQVPVLLVYLIGFVLALLFFGRQPTAALLTLIGTGLLVLVTVAVVVVQAFLVQQRMEENWSVERFARLMSTVGLAGSIGRAIGLALVVAAVFVGRGHTRPAIAGPGAAPAGGPPPGA